MKRHSALVELSRDHQHALAVAHLLQHADEPTSSQAAAAFEAFWLAEARAHFRLEEEVLLPAYALYGQADHPCVVRVLLDHMLIRAAAKRVGRGNVSVARLHMLGQRLADHVRLEERELFPLIETTLTEAELDGLGAELAATTRE